MKTTTKLRVIGGGVLLVNLWAIGRYRLEGVAVLLLTFGFATAYEFLIVRTASAREKRLGQTTAPLSADIVAQQAPSTPAEQMTPASPAPQQPKESPVSTTQAADHKCWAEALAEFESEQRSPGLWAMCFAQCDGDDARAKAMYLRHRVAELVKPLAPNVTAASSAVASQSVVVTVAQKELTERVKELRACVRFSGNYRDAFDLAEALGYTVGEVGVGFFKSMAIVVTSPSGERIQFDNRPNFVKWARDAQ